LSAVVLRQLQTDPGWFASTQDTWRSPPALQLQSVDDPKLLDLVGMQSRMSPAMRCCAHTHTHIMSIRSVFVRLSTQWRTHVRIILTS